MHVSSFCSLPKKHGLSVGYGIGGESSNGLQRDVRVLKADPAETHTELHTEPVAIFRHIAAVKVKGKTDAQLSDLASPPVTVPLVPAGARCELLISRHSDHKKYR